MILTVRCPRCHNVMKYQTANPHPADKSKQCVYCNRSFKVTDNIAMAKPGTPKAEFTSA